jgi:hypothetical protein
MDTNNNYPNDQNNTEKKQHTCPYCQKHFLKIEDLNSHVLTKHTGSYSLRKPSQEGQEEAPASTSS